jgi:ubiquinone biosynthesis protein COQ9
MITWFGDDSDDEAPTAAFLDARIDNVLQFEKLKARFTEACTTPPGKTS